jgi:hypothetical protein
MSKVDKKIKKLQERLQTMESELRLSLTKKDSNTKEIDVPTYQRRIQETRLELSKLEKERGTRAVDAVVK